MEETYERRFEELEARVSALENTLGPLVPVIRELAAQRITRFQRRYQDEEDSKPTIPEIYDALKRGGCTEKVGEDERDWIPNDISIQVGDYLLDELKTLYPEYIADNKEIIRTKILKLKQSRGFSRYIPLRIFAEVFIKKE